MSDTAMRDTPYATELAHSSFTFPDGSEGRIERLRFKDDPYAGLEGIRFSWWKDGRMVPRPLDATEDQLLAMLSDSFQKNVFSQRFLADLLWTILGQARESAGRPSGDSCHLHAGDLQVMKRAFE